MDAREILTQEMIALGSGDTQGLLALLQAKTDWLRQFKLQPEHSREVLLDLWRRNRQILNACRQVSPPVPHYGRKISR